MDLNETLRAIRDLIANPGNTPEDISDDLDSISEHFEALDAWLSRGGFLPDAWAKHVGQVTRPLFHQEES